MLFWVRRVRCVSYACRWLLRQPSGVVKKKPNIFPKRTTHTHMYNTFDCFDCSLLVLNELDAHSIVGGQQNKSDNPACLVVQSSYGEIIYFFSFFVHILTRAKNFYVCFCTIRKWFNPLSCSTSNRYVFLRGGRLVFLRSRTKMHRLFHTENCQFTNEIEIRRDLKSRNWSHTHEN